MGKKEKLKFELIRVYYQTARENLANRLRIRDLSIICYLITISFLFGTSFMKDSGFYELPLLVVPFLSFATMILVNNHNEYVARIVHYLGNDIHKELKKLDLDIPEWSSAQGHLELHKNQWFGADRAKAELLIIVLPTVIALLLNLRNFIPQVGNLFSSKQIWNLNHLLLLGWFLGLFCLILTITTNVKANRFKASVYASLPGRKHKKNRP